MLSWCCKSNAVVEDHHAPKKLASSARAQQQQQQQQQEDANSTAATNNSEEDGSDMTEHAQDSTHANFIIHQLSSHNKGSFSTSERNDYDTIQRHHEQSVMRENASVVVVSYDEDDNITTVYSEDTPLPNSTFKRNRRLTNNHLNSVDRRHAEVLPSSNAYVLLPDVPQRGYEASGWVQYPDRDKWIRTKPYDIGTLVWYRHNCSDTKFRWYIPGQIKDYVLSGDRVEGYEIQVECQDHILERHELGISSLLKNAPPENTMLRWDEKVPTCPVKGIDVAEIPKHGLLPEKALDLARMKYGNDLGFRGAKQNGLGPEMWGITMEQINDICKHPNYDESMSMYDVVNNVVKPTTAGTGMSYALLCNKESPVRARVMVSHAWQENFKQFVEALVASKVEGPFWVCALSIYQNEDLPNMTIKKQLGPSPSSGPFSTVLKQADRMVAIMTDSCDIYTRLWCVYEIFTAMTLNVPISLASYNNITTSGGSSDAMYTNVVLDSSSKEISTFSAECGDQYDKDMIQKEILEKVGGFEVIDDAVMWVRIKALIDDMPSARQKVLLETMVYRPCGTCSASNIVTRQNAAIASAIQVWNDAKARRSAKESKLKKECKGYDFHKDDSETSKGLLKTFQNKIFNCGQMCNF